MDKDPNRRRLIEAAGNALTKQLINEGRLIEAGFEILENAVIPKDAPQIQRDEMRLAFMAGAEHVFSSLMSVMDPGDEPTNADLRRMQNIHRELDEWRVKISERVHPTQGTA